VRGGKNACTPATGGGSVAAAAGSLDFSKRDTAMLKGVAILFMLFLHLFCRIETDGLYTVFLRFQGYPLIYYFSIFCDAVVPIYCFTSGYGLFAISLKRLTWKDNGLRVLKLLLNYWIVLFLFAAAILVMGEPEKLQSVSAFVSNFFLLRSYVGAWWFLASYVLLVLLSPLFLEMLKRVNVWVVLALSLGLYCVAYLQTEKTCSPCKVLFGAQSCRPFKTWGERSSPSLLV
jgi:hypothetical protein